MSFRWPTFNKNSKRFEFFEFLLTMSFYWHKGSFSWSVFILMRSLCVHGHYYWWCADKWSFIMTVYTRLKICGKFWEDLGNFIKNVQGILDKLWVKFCCLIVKRKFEHPSQLQRKKNSLIPRKISKKYMIFY